MPREPMNPDPRQIETALFRDRRNPRDRQLDPDYEGICPPNPRERINNLLKGATFPDGRPVNAGTGPSGGGGIFVNRGWSSVALFFNLAEARRPGDYRETTAA